MPKKQDISQNQSVELEAKQAPELQEEHLLHPLEGEKKKPMTFSKKYVAIFVGIIAFGIISGFGLAQLGGGSVARTSGEGGTTDEGLQKVVGLDDIKGKDEVDGILVEGGIENEGTHHLEREGGPSQNVYLTSSVVPLDDYVGKKVKVYGETFAAQSAGWLMDVVRLELIE